MRKIIILFPTVRPQRMKESYGHAIAMASGDYEIILKIAVNTHEQANKLRKFKDILVLGNKRRGVTWASYQLSKNLTANPHDIVILSSDDFFFPKNWDRWIINQFKNKHGCLMVNDGYQTEKCITLPIMTFQCLKRLKNIIYHPAYVHQFSDSELYLNVKELDMLYNKRNKKFPLFDHRHWANKKRKRDAHDNIVIQQGGRDETTFHRRRRLPLARRLIVNG